MLSSILLWLEHVNSVWDMTWNVFAFALGQDRATAVADTLDAEGKTLSWVHTLSCCPCWLQAVSWSLPMGFSIMHQCIHYSLYPLAPGKGSLSWGAHMGQRTATRLACGHRKGFKSKVLPLRRHASCVVSAIAESEIPEHTAGQDIHKRRGNAEMKVLSK